MDAAESPLDVLTRAATMVQNNILPPSYEEARLCREEATSAGGKWRRQRQIRRNNQNFTSREPIDLSTRKIRGSPPSYKQTMQAKQAASALNRIESSGGVCDPMIDEHFRRSLGKDYQSNSSAQSGEKSGSADRLEDSSSLSVDDHFAKALGDTWVKLQKEEKEKEKGQKPERRQQLEEDDSSEESEDKSESEKDSAEETEKKS